MARPAGTPVVFLLDADPTLADAIPADELPLARRTLIAPVASYPAGDAVDVGAADDRAIALLVLDGLLLREVGDDGAAALLGPGAVIPPPGTTEDEPVAERFTAITAARLAEIRLEVLRAAFRWPAAARALNRRLLGEIRTSWNREAALVRPRIDDQLVALFADFARRWGRVTPGGVLLEVPLTHELLGRVLGAKRSSVTTALRRLAQSGTLRRDGEGWVLALDAVVAEG